jgi:hypothetical protein
LFIAIPIAGLVLVAPDAQAYKFYSDDSGAVGDGTQNCAACHGEFRSGTYMPPSGAPTWAGTLHQGHLNGTNVGSLNCDNCHGGVDTIQRGVNLSSSGTGPGGVMALACVGCHGRQADTVGNPNALGDGWGAGLRQHHNANGIGLCAGCHADANPANFTPAGEDAMPMYYPQVTNIIAGTPLEPCNINGEEDFESDPSGLDNDGDNLYDAADPDCVDLCGNGVIDIGEACDDGPANGTTECGCQLDCTYTPADTACGDPSVSECDLADTCDGMGACEPNIEPDGTACGDPTDTQCDNPDTCLSGFCEPNYELIGTVCDDGLFCTGDPPADPDTCNGLGICDPGPGNPCQPTELCQEPDQCIPQVDCGNGVIDPGEACDDGAANGETDCGCQLDCQYAPEFTACGDPNATECDDPDSCDGMGTCDPRYVAAGSACGDQGVECLVDDTCDGMGICEDNGLEPDGTACGDPSNTDCDNPDTCLTGACAPNNEPDGTPCGDPSNTDCTNPDTCLSAACAPNDEPAGTVCDDGLFCTDPDACDGAGVCEGGPSPCIPGEVCDEDNDICVESVGPPPVNQNIGIDDGVFNNLVENDCRFCHEGDDPNINVEGRCSETGTLCFVDADCTGGTDVCVDVTIVDRHHILALTPENIPPTSLIFVGTCSVSGDFCRADAECPSGETCDIPRAPVETDRDNDGVNDTIYGCENCHPDDPATPVIEFTVTRDCLECHLQVAGEGSVHHLTATANGDDSPIGDPNVGDCTPCHGTLVDDTGDGHVIPTYAPSLVTPRRSQGLGPDNSYGDGRGACNFCHNQDTVPPADPIAIFSNRDTHHSTGFFAQGVCDWCHNFGLPFEAQIRVCENCHGLESLHNIAVDSDATGDVDTDGDGILDTPNLGNVIIGAENPYWSHIGNNDDCLGCHGGYIPASAPGTGPVTPYISSSSVSIMTAGTDRAVTLTGSAFTNYVGANLWTSVVKMTASDGSAVILTPDSITSDQMIVTIPGTTAAGNYELNAAKGTASSNPVVISVIPAVVITDDSCRKKQGILTIDGSGFGDKPAGTNDYINVAINGNTVDEADITSWTDTRIRVSVSSCSNNAAITVNATFGSASNGDSGGGDPPGGGCSDNTDEASCVDAGCSWNSKKGICKDARGGGGGGKDKNK